ncbi:Transposase IS66 family [Variovorax sp. CF313]|nr:Transposase IS66 family [Variovorax sp. CF313]
MASAHFLLMDRGGNRRAFPDGSATAKALNYSLKRWAALTRYLDDGSLPADNNWVENQIRPIAMTCS